MPSKAWRWSACGLVAAKFRPGSFPGRSHRNARAGRVIANIGTLYRLRYIFVMLMIVLAARACFDLAHGRLNYTRTNGLDAQPVIGWR